MKKTELLLLFIILFFTTQITYHYYQYKLNIYRKYLTHNIIRKIKQIIELYHQKTGKLPYSFKDLIPLYLKAIPEDGWGKKIILDMEKGFIISCGSDKKEATYDDIIIKTSLSLFALKTIEIIKKNHKSEYLEKGDILRLIFTKKVIHFGKTPDNDFLFYDQRGFPLRKDANNKNFSFGNKSYYSFYENDDRIVDLIIQNDTNILLNHLRLNLKYSPFSNKNRNSFQSQLQYGALPASAPLLLNY